jgi:hypothetical protein
MAREAVEIMDADYNAAKQDNQLIKILVDYENASFEPVQILLKHYETKVTVTLPLLGW